jgi:hypothetical protein
MNIRPKIGDYIITLIFISVAVVFLLSWTINSQKGSYAHINASGKIYEYPLNEDRIVKITSGRKGLAVFEIKGGKIRFLKSNCPRGICKKFGYISRPGQTSICIPNRIAVTIKGKNNENGVDTVCR